MPEPSDWGKRLRILIDRYDFGNIAAASRRLGASPRGLGKVIDGETTNPRADLLEALVRRYPVDPAWLLTGSKSEAWAKSEERVQKEARHMAVKMIADFILLVDSEAAGTSLAALASRTEDDLREAVQRLSRIIGGG